MIRPHHGMCLAFFEGKGYSEKFTAHMGKVLKMFEQNKTMKIYLTADTDTICGACPNNQGNVCKDKKLVRHYDQEVLKSCDLKEGQEIPFGTFAELVQEKIIASGERETICGNCQWNKICGRKESRWAKIC